MKFFFLLLFPLMAWGQVKTEGFIIEIQDRSMRVLSPEKKRQMFSVIIDNKSLTDQIGKFVAGNKTLKFVSVPSGKSEVVEIENKSSQNVSFIPVSPAFQDISLEHGKKAYEVPSKK